MNWDTILSELTFRTSRSSGAGGQHVNKTETKVHVLFDLPNSNGLTDEEKVLLLKKLAASVTDENILIITSQKSRSQFSNKEDAIEKLRLKLEKALVPKVKRIKTKPSKASVEDRLLEKKRISEKKEQRKRPPH